MSTTLLTAFALLPLLQPPSEQDAPRPRNTPRDVRPEQRVEWQRSLADALAVQQRTGLPLLIAVNMDGEVFNERFATTTYRDRAFVESTRGYVCIVASPDRHNERDYDAFGNRIECPRFGGCTCSEHINVEPELYERFFAGRRNAPRHVGVSKDGKVLFDRYLDQRMQTAIDAIAKHRGAPPADAWHVPDDLDALFSRRDAASRRALEVRYTTGGEEQRAELLRRARNATNEPFDLLRMGLHDTDERLRVMAAMALAEIGGPAALIDIEDALARIDDAELRQRLVEQLRRIGAEHEGAARLAAHFEAVPERLARPWRNDWRSTPLQQGRAGIESELDRIEKALQPARDDDALRLDLATAQAAFGLHLMAAGDSAIELWLADAERNAGRVTTEQRVAEARAVQAIVAWYRSDPETAATACVEAMADADSDRLPTRWLAENLLDVHLQLTARTAYARASADEGATLRAELTHTLTALQTLHDRDAGREAGMLAGIGLLEFAGRRAEARTWLERAAQRFPTSTTVHERWRNRLLVDLGAERMRHRYAAYAGEATDRATTQWFAAYAALIAAELHTRDERTVETDNAYTDAIERFADSARRNPDYADSADHYTVLALAGRAWIRHVRGFEKDAVEDLLRAASLRPASLDLDDGLQRKPRGIADRIHRALTAAGNQELATRLQTML